jgi:hypothetical protein
MRVIAREGELGEMFAFPTEFDSDRICHLVKTGAQVVDCIEHDAGHIERKFFGEFGLEKMLSEIRVVFNDRGVWLFRTKPFDGSFEVHDMMICALKDSFSASKRVLHGEVRSNERV